jgi:hypothetical protein
VAFFILKNRTGAHFKYPNVTIPPKGSAPLEVDAGLAGLIRDLKNPVVIECDAAGVPLQAKAKIALKELPTEPPVKAKKSKGKKRADESSKDTLES